MIKKIFITSAILLFLSATFWGVYNFAFQDTEKIKLLNAEDVNVDDDNTSQNESKVVRISDSAVIAPTLDKENKLIIFYNKNNGNVETVSFDGTIKNTIFENNLGGIIDVIWSPNKNFVVSTFAQEKKNKFYLYSYITRKSIELKEGIDNVVWDNQGDKIIYKYFDKASNERSLNIADPNGKNWKKIVSLGEEFKHINLTQVPQTLFVSFWSYPDAHRKTSLNKVNMMDGSNLEKIAEDRLGANYLWSPDGRSFLVSSVDAGGNNIKMEIALANGTNYMDLNLPTLADKCVWTKDSMQIYCALPTIIAEGSVFPNDYQENKILTKDTFWRVDIKTGKKDRIVELENLNNGEYDATNLFLAPNEKILFFINRYDGKLYKINI